MLPGFRFLFAAITLSTSLLVFGLGAASLLRAAHQAFASSPSWRGAPDVTFAPRADAPPMLASLRVDPPTLDKAPDETTVAPHAVVHQEAAPSVVEPVTTQIAALSVEAANPPAAEPAPPAAEVVVKPDDTKPDEISNEPRPDAARVAAVVTSEASPVGSEPVIMQVEPETAAKPDSPAADTATPAANSEAKIAVLGGSPVQIVPETPAREKRARPDQANADQSAIKKRVHARRASHRRRLAARARLLAQQQLLQQQANPFAQILPDPTTTATLTPAPAKRRHKVQAAQAIKPAP